MYTYKNSFKTQERPFYVFGFDVFDFTTHGDKQTAGHR